MGLGAVSFAVPGCANLASRSVDTAAKKKPNIIFILADDLGWAELGCYGNRFNETPYLDQLAGKAVRFTQAYASAPVCSPYRASLMTGQFRHELV
jgi:arylsulfatase A